MDDQLIEVNIHMTIHMFPVLMVYMLQTRTLTSLHSMVSHKRTEVSAEFQRLNVLLLRAGSGRRIGTALLTDARVQVSRTKTEESH